MTRKRYVVAGGFGFLGTAVCSTLRKQGARLVVVDRERRSALSIRQGIK